MPRVLLALGLAAAGASASACGCAYGGPGCGSPAIEGLCQARLEVGQSAVVTAVFGDDTGYHPAEICSAEVADQAVLEVARTAREGELSLTAGAPGRTELRLQLEGWDDELFAWSFTVADETGPPAAECPDALLPDLRR